ncbi:MAG: hypothetical protein LBS56_00690 [Propionibacteriaceae bacterium]|jgi:hypothetical protein|nr:hypothetical protein [Propionibacteriaceae bacterium]
MGAELAAIIGAASVAKGLVSAAVARGALASFVGVGAAVAAAKTAAAAARGVSHMVIDDAVDAVEAYAAGLSLRSLDAEAQHGVLTWAAETIERHFDSDAEEAYTDCVYSLANAHAGYSQLLRTVADAATRYASKLSFHRGQAHAALARLAGPIFRIDGVEVRPRDVIDKEAADAEDARIIDLINKELGDIESDLELAVEHCEELLSQQALIISTLLQARDRIVDTVRHLPQQFDLASHGGGGRNEYDRFRPGEIHPGQSDHTHGGR